MRALGWLRLTHPFPSILDGLVSGGVALLAGGAVLQALGAGVAMTLLQLGIGTTNDLVDAPRDAARKPGKPIPAGLVGRDAATRLAVACFAVGSGIAWSLSIVAGLLSLLVIAIGLAYDLRLKGTAWSWLPFAVGIPILPVFGWLAVRADLPETFAFLVPVAIVAGAALAIGNSLVDVERDRAAGVTSIAAALGVRRASRVAMVLFFAVYVATNASVFAWEIANRPGGFWVQIAGAMAAVAAVYGGSARPIVRERAWRAEAVGTAVLAITWLAAVSSAGRLF